ncbi:MAG: hypothetical protein A2Y94_09260 [Caldithrix sp. RBG_13_44_9]|nr:MAG: hypothetical protein A2Y94_09260 [Caldithrix sp. RBG_13_44_9]
MNVEEGNGMKSFIFVLLIVTLIPALVMAQYEESVPLHGNEYGAGITLAMAGFGLGGFYRISLPGYFHVGVNLDFYMMRDENEFTYYDYWGYPRQINKFNRLFIIPLSVDLKKRFFYNSIEDDFRPYFIGLGGLTFGMNFPNENDLEFSYLPPEEQARLPRENEYQLSLNIGFGIGVDVTTNQEYFLSLRPQYRFIYFPQPIAGQTNHSNFEIRLELGKRLVKP